MSVLICPSLMCADQLDLKNEINSLIKAGADFMHIDVMDGVFVPNIQLGAGLMQAIKNGTGVPLDIHLMIEAPHGKLGYFPIGEGDIVSVHYESTPHPARVADGIRAKGAKALLALNPGTPLSVFEDISDCFDGLLIMTVNPGYSGQKLIPKTIDKIRRARLLYPDIIIEADGNVSFTSAKEMVKAGASALVCGTSSVFSKEFDYKTSIERLKEL